MPWTFQQSDGFILSPNGGVTTVVPKYRYSAYAGRGEGRNNPAAQDVRAGERLINGVWVAVDGLGPNDWGPLPRGKYAMQPPVNTASHGPFVLWLTPDSANEMYGRSAFGIHGDSIEHPGLASQGCICTTRSVRERIWSSDDHALEVVF